MELKQAKPIHLRRPKCGYDFSYNTNHIEERIDGLKRDITSITSQIQAFKLEHPKDFRKYEWYRKAKAVLSSKQAQLVDAKKARKSTVSEIKEQQNKIFYQLVKEKLGADEALKLMKEAENQLVYCNWDMATQTLTRFEGV